MRLLFSFDDYCEQNYKVADLLEKYKRKAIFFIDGIDIPTKMSQAIDLHKRGHIIGGHTINHPADIKILPREIARYEISECKQLLDAELNTYTEWFAYPKGKYSDDTKQIVKDAGFQFARTVNVNKWINNDCFAKGTVAHIYPRSEYHGEIWYQFALRILNKIKDIEDAEFHIWGHGWEIEKFNYWDQLERFLKILQEYETTGNINY